MAIPKTKEELWQRIKKGEQFSDDTLASFGIKRTIRDVKVYTDPNIVEHVKDKKKYPVDTTPLSKVISELSVLENQKYVEPVDND